MSEVELWCGVYHKGTIFPVRIQSNVTVYDLKMAIVSEKTNVYHRFKVDPADLNLYFAKKKNEDGTWAKEWLEENEKIMSWLRMGRQEDDMYEKMMPGWNLQDYLGEKFDLESCNIHILVELPRDESMEPATKKPRVEMEWEPENPVIYSLDRYNMYFVNRELAAKQLFEIHRIKYARAADCDGRDWVIPIVDNVSGLGKSCFGKHYIKKIKEFTDVKNEFKSTIDACHTVHVMFRRGEIIQANNGLEMDFLMTKILIRTLEPMFVQLPAILSKPPKENRSYEFLYSLTQEVGPLFIVLDGIGDAFSHDTMNAIEQRKVFYCFCEIVLGSWLHMKNIFFLLAGRASFFSYVGQRIGLNYPFSSSPFQFERIKLYLLRKEHIKLILTHTTVTCTSQDTIAKHLGLTEEEIDLATSTLYKQTCGHPRSLLGALIQCKTKHELFHFKQPMFYSVHQWPKFYAAMFPHKETILELVKAADDNEAAEKIGLTHTVDLMTRTLNVDGRELTWDIVSNIACMIWEGEMSAAIIRVYPNLRLHLENWFLPFRTYVERIANIEEVSIHYSNAFAWMCLKRFQEIFYREHQPSQALPTFFNTPTFGDCTKVKFTSFTWQPMSSSPDAFLHTKAQFRNKHVKLVCGLTVKSNLKTPFTENELKKEIKECSQWLDDPNENELRILFICCTKYTKSLISKVIVDDQWFGVYPILDKYAKIDEVILLDLQSSDQWKVFFGADGDFLIALENVIRKTEVECESNKDES